MVNMNKYKDPAVYGLTDPDGGIFYVGRTKTNPLNRWWQHRYRARINHPAPVYQRWNEIGLDSVGFTVLQELTGRDDAARVEAEWIARLISDGSDLVNQSSRDGVPDSMSQDAREKIGRSNRGKPTWIVGKRGVDAGWTDERRQALRDRAAATRADRVPIHGRVLEYVKYGCRCDACRSSHSVAQAAYRKRVRDAAK